MSWWEYVQRHAAGETQAAIAAAAGVTGPTVSRWSTGKQGVDPRAAAAFARAYRRPVLEAFVAAGFLTAEEAKARPSVEPDYSRLSNDELLRLVRSRMKEEIGDERDPAPNRKAGRAGDESNVHHLDNPSTEFLEGLLAQQKAAAERDKRRQRRT